MRSMQRYQLRVVNFALNQSISGRISITSGTETAGVVTITTPSAHLYTTNTRIFINNATGTNAAFYNSPVGFVIQTIPSATTFTIAVPTGTGNIGVGGTTRIDQPVLIQGDHLAAIQFPTPFAATAVLFLGSLEPLTDTTTQINVLDVGGGNIQVVSAAGALVVMTTPESKRLAGYATLWLTRNDSTATARCVLSFIRNNE